ncbi:Uncharacterised protein [Yersinia enterocolitica]|uniref:Uncharacterized protein n=1 Tax=Yersinia enterocolitica TaxID=630 RepID=A0ABM9SI07_YEREN|nr:Uncharacterised protein [Yersinia enterocolitica]CRX96430.1 Uncharacterised protein [Yersinia enterocolitica]
MAKNALTTLGVNHIYKIYNMLFLESVHNSVSRLKYHYNVITLSRRPSK